jgi:hypothetical protein
MVRYSSGAALVGPLIRPAGTFSPCGRRGGGRGAEESLDRGVTPHSLCQSGRRVTGQVSGLQGASIVIVVVALIIVARVIVALILVHDRDEGP